MLMVQVQGLRLRTADITRDHRKLSLTLSSNIYWDPLSNNNYSEDSVLSKADTFVPLRNRERSDFKSIT